MKKLKRIDLTVTYRVELEDVDLPDEVYDDLIGLYDSGVYKVKPDTTDEMESNVCDWLADNVCETDCYTISYEIDDIEEDE